MFTLLSKSPAALRTTTNISRVSGLWFARSLRGDGLRSHRWFRQTSKLFAIKPYLLADVGEGITECQIISWAVKPGDKVNEFDLICEVQSDKASVEITSRFDGIIEKLHYEVGDVAKVGSTLVDIDTTSESSDVSELSRPDESRENDESSDGSQPQESLASPVLTTSNEPDTKAQNTFLLSNESSTLIAPAVRRLLKENNIDPNKVRGTGKDGRILKEDVLKHVDTLVATFSALRPNATSATTTESRGDEDRRVSLSPVQNQMFKSMTSSLAIPHFLYTHTVNMTSLARLIEQFQTDRALPLSLTGRDGHRVKLTLLPFVLKALSLAIQDFPIINSILDASDSEAGKQPELIVKSSHNFGFAVDTPGGLLVPVVCNVQDHSILSLATEISRLGRLARDGKASPNDMRGATLVVSNIGSIGGNVVAPVILSPMTAIVAIGKMEEVLGFGTDKDGKEIIVRKNQVTLSWSADHRVLDGATVARCAQQVATWLEKPEYLALIIKQTRNDAERVNGG